MVGQCEEYVCGSLGFLVIEHFPGLRGVLFRELGNLASSGFTGCECKRKKGETGYWSDYHVR
jgi:hypothetical protein